MVSQIVKTFHADLCHAYGRENIGEVEDLHPLVVKIAEETFPRGGETNERYEQFIASASEDFQALPDAIRTLVSPVTFHKLMSNFAAGIQYAAHKYKEPINVGDFEFSHTLKKYGYDMEEFFASAIPELEKIVIHPQIIAIGKSAEGKEMDFEKLPGRFRMDEIAALVGVEQMVYMHHCQKDPDYKPGYEVVPFDKDQYRRSQSVQESTALMELAVRELQLGSGFRVQKS